MKHRRSLLLVMVGVVLAGAASCGSSGDPEVTGLTLESSEAKALVVDQFYVNGGLDDEFSDQGEFSLYLRDAATGKDMACAGADAGMDTVAMPGVYYGTLDIDLATVRDDDSPSSAARFQILVVEKDGKDCPEPISEDDDIVGQSAELTFEDLLEQPIWTTNGLATVTLRVRGQEEVAIPAMSPSLDSGLIIDQLFFNNGSEGREANRYYIFAERMEGGTAVEQCQVEDQYLTNIQYGAMTYAALGIPIDCFDATDPNFSDLQVKVSLWIQREKGPALVGETEVAPIGEVIGEERAFTNGKGFIKFRSVETTPFSASIVRLEEVTSLSASDLTYVLSPSLSPTIELHVLPEDAPYSIACAGDEQGLTGVTVPGSYDDLSAQLVAVTGRQELFGWDQVVIKLVDRTDGKACPDPLETEPTVLAETSSLTPSGLSGRSFTFLVGGGSVAFGLSDTMASESSVTAAPDSSVNCN